MLLHFKDWLLSLLTTNEKIYNIETWGQCYKTNTVVIYCHYRLNYYRNIYNIEFTL